MTNTMSDILQVKKSWIKVGNVFTLFAEIDKKVLCDNFCVLDTNPGSEPVVVLNKQLKEFDMVERIKREYKVGKVELI